MTVSGSAASCAELLAHPALKHTDVALLDLRLGNADALECVPALVEAGVQVVVLTGELDPARHRAAVMHGARGVVLKSDSAERIVKAIEQVHAGEMSLDGSLVALLLGQVPGMAGTKAPAPTEDQRRIASLTPKERQVVHAVVAHRGAKSLVIADALGMSENTLRNHLTVIYSKLNVQGRLNLYLYAVEHGLASPTAGTATTSRAAAPSVWALEPGHPTAHCRRSLADLPAVTKLVVDPGASALPSPRSHAVAYWLVAARSRAANERPIDPGDLRAACARRR